jgi:hypothetical protein
VRRQSSESLIEFKESEYLLSSFSFSYWLNYLPLKTTERALHLVHPESRHWSFVLQSGDLDDPHFKYYAWELAPCVPSTSGRKTTAIVMAMPPWTLTPTDLQCFAACKEARNAAIFYLSEPTLPLFVQFPQFGETGRTRLNDDQRIWGKASRSVPNVLLPILIA